VTTTIHISTIYTGVLHGCPQHLQPSSAAATVSSLLRPGVCTSSLLVDTTLDTCLALGCCPLLLSCLGLAGCSFCCCFSLCLWALLSFSLCRRLLVCLESCLLICLAALWPLCLGPFGSSICLSSLCGLLASSLARSCWACSYNITAHRALVCSNRNEFASLYSTKAVACLRSSNNTG